MVNQNILARIEKEYLEEEKDDSKEGLPAQKCKLIIHYLVSLPHRHIINVMPSLCRASRDRGDFEEYISMLLYEIFMDCKTASEVISLADKLIYDINTKKKDIFKNLVPDYMFGNLGEDLLFKIGHDGIETDKQKICRRACEKLCCQLIKYIHPYVEGVLRRKSILCELFCNQCKKEGVAL